MNAHRRGKLLTGEAPSPRAGGIAGEDNERTLDEVTNEEMEAVVAANPDVVVLRIKTFGGRVDAAVTPASSSLPMDGFSLLSRHRAGGRARSRSPPTRAIAGVGTVAERGSMRPRMQVPWASRAAGPDSNRDTAAAPVSAPLTAFPGHGLLFGNFRRVNPNVGNLLKDACREEFF